MGRNQCNGGAIIVEVEIKQELDEETYNVSAQLPGFAILARLQVPNTPLFVFKLPDKTRELFPKSRIQSVCIGE